MKKVLIVIAALGLLNFYSCTPNSVQDDFEYGTEESTDKKDSTNSNGGNSGTVDNDED
ncbi:hypothetical protein [Kordia sp.]|uniref:hypothetical protein n=1 Tax=Kordia sp. TaxID=1965332 RepID=UPI0025BFB8F9|nr:hypothetical protein [Kordia sp.]MCH2195367.1 hypothetical protein [Kordia sp.]